jgi:hypothetical protein
MTVVSLWVSLNPRLELRCIAGVSQVEVGAGQEGRGFHLALSHILKNEKEFQQFYFFSHLQLLHEKGYKQGIYSGSIGKFRRFSNVFPNLYIYIDLSTTNFYLKYLKRCS